MNSVLLWFSSDPYPTNGNHIILWQQYLSSENSSSEIYSLPQLVHGDSERWKRTYLQWLNKVGQSSVGDATLEQRLLIRSDLSYWWMTLPVEFSFTEDATAYKSVRLWAFVELAERLDITELELSGAPPDVAEVLKVWCEQTGRKITSLRKPRRVWARSSVSSGIKNSSSILLQGALGLLILVQEFIRFGLKRNEGPSRVVPSAKAVTIIDYFDNFRVNENLESRYESAYWGGLPELLAAMKIPVRWIHIDVRSSSAPSPRKAFQSIQILNQNEAGQVHCLLQGATSLSVLAAEVRCFFHIVTLGISVSKARISWIESESLLNMWPVIKQPWRKAFYGVNAAQNAGWRVLFRRMLEVGQDSEQCLYLMENQPWEIGMISSWREGHSGKIYGVPHSTVRKWDLRYAVGFNGDSRTAAEALPQPNKILVNGAAAENVFYENGYSSGQIHPVEAVRYIRNKEVLPPDLDSQLNTMGEVEVVVLGEYDEGLALRQIELLNKLIGARATNASFRYRPHPSTDTHLNLIDERITVSAERDIAFDLVRSDLVFCSNVSSASLDALLMGVPVIMLLDGSVFDGQPEGGSGARYVTKSEELIAAFDQITSGRFEEAIVPESVFNLDPELPKWKLMLTSLS